MRDPNDTSEFQPLNVLDSHSEVKTNPSKRSRKNVSSNVPGPTEDDDESGSTRRRQRRKSNPHPTGNPSSGPNTTENKRRDSIKFGLEELQRVLPHIKRPEEEKVSNLLTGRFYR